MLGGALALVAWIGGNTWQSASSNTKGITARFIDVDDPSATAPYVNVTADTNGRHVDVLRTQARVWAVVAVGAEAPVPTSLDILDPEATGWLRDPRVLPVPRVASEAPFRDIICAPEFTWPCSWAEATVMCESSGNPNAYATETINGITYEFVGWFQVLGGSYDPYTNAVQAHRQYVQWQRGERGRPWPGCP